MHFHCHIIEQNQNIISYQQLLDIFINSDEIYIQVSKLCQVNNFGLIKISENIKKIFRVLNCLNKMKVPNVQWPIRYIVMCFSLIVLTFSTNITSQLPFMQSSFTSLYYSNSTSMSRQINLYNVTFKRIYIANPQIFYFINSYKMGDRFAAQDVSTIITLNLVDKFQIQVYPVSSTSIMSFSISWIAAQNSYANMYNKAYQYNSPSNLTTGSGSRTFTSNAYTITSQFPGAVMSSNSSQNKIIVSLTGFSHVTTINGGFVDISINPYFMNITTYQIKLSTDHNDFWNRLNILVLLINMQLYPSVVQFESATIVVTPYVSQYTFSKINLNNMSYCFGLAGLLSLTSNAIEININKLNSTSISVDLKYFDYLRFTYLALWNFTIVNDPVPPIDPPVIPPEPPVVPVTPTTPNNQQSSTVGIIVGVVVGVLVLATIAVVVYKFRIKKGVRVQMEDNINKEMNIFSPSFI